MLSMIVAMGVNREIGLNGKMPWNLPEDLQRFKQITLGKTMIMGRGTLESLPGILPKRKHVVVSSNPNYGQEHAHPRVRYTQDLSEELENAKESVDEFFIVGGGTIYQQAMPFADKLYLTLVHNKYPEADTYFPVVIEAEWEEINRSPVLVDAVSGIKFEYVDLVRREKK